MAMIPRLGQVDLTLTAGQSLVVGSFGAGQTKILTAAVSTSALPPVYTQTTVLTGNSAYITYAAATNVRIEASPASDVEYDFGTQPALTNSPQSVTTGLTARAGGGQGSATPLTGAINRVATVASAADSVLLPAAVVGRRVSVFNAGANSMNVFPASGEAIGTGSANAAQAVGAAKGAIFECVATGVWNYTLSA